MHVDKQGGDRSGSGHGGRLFSSCYIVLSVMGWWSAKGLGGVQRMEARVQWGAQRYDGYTWAMQHFCPVPGRGYLGSLSTGAGTVLGIRNGDAHGACCNGAGRRGSLV